MVRAERSGRKISFENIKFDCKEIETAVACGAAIAVGMPVGQTIATRISAPFKSESKARRIFPTLLDIQLPFPLEDCLYNFTETIPEIGVSPHITSSAENDKSSASKNNAITTLAIAARKTDIERRLSELANKGIDPHVLDYEGIALWTQFLHEYSDNKYIKNNHESFNILTFLRGEEGILVVGRGTYFLNAHKFKTAEPATLDRYLQTTFNKLEYSNKKSPDINWFWAGSDVYDNNNAKTLKTHISKRWVDKSTTVDDPETFLARALATRALLPGPLRTNLRIDKFIHSGAQTHIHTAKNRTATTILIAGMLLCCASIIWEYSSAMQHNLFRKQFKSRIVNMLGYSPPAQGANLLLIAERELETISEQQKPLSNIFLPSLLTELQKIVNITNKHNLKIEQLQLETGKLQINGTSTIKDNIQHLTKSISDMGYNSEITVEKTDDDETVIFILNATTCGGEE